MRYCNYSRHPVVPHCHECFKEAVSRCSSFGRSKGMAALDCYTRSDFAGHSTFIIRGLSQMWTRCAQQESTTGFLALSPWRLDSSTFSDKSIPKRRQRQEHRSLYLAVLCNEVSRFSFGTDTTFWNRFVGGIFNGTSSTLDFPDLVEFTRLRNKSPSSLTLSR